MTEIKGKRLFVGMRGVLHGFSTQKGVSLPALGWQVLLGCPCPKTGGGLWDQWVTWGDDSSVGFSCHVILSSPGVP